VPHIPNPYSIIKNWWDNRAVNKIRNQHKYSLLAYINRHDYTKEKDDLFVVLAVIGWFGCILIGGYTGQTWISMMSFVVLFGGLFWPFVMGFIEEWQLSKKLTLTQKIIPNNPEETRPFTVRLEGVEFGAPMQTPEELVTFLSKKNATVVKAIYNKRVTSCFGRIHPKNINASFDKDKASAEAKRVMDEANKQNMKLYPMQAKGDPVPTLILFPEDPEAILRPRVEHVRMGYKVSDMKHATVYVLECEPVKTSIEAKNKIIDVEFALFAPIVTQKGIDDWLVESKWHIPTRIVQEVATYVKQNVDNSKNARAFETLEREKSQVNNQLSKLMLLGDLGEMQFDMQGNLIKPYTKVSGGYSLNDVIMWSLVGFAAGAVLMMQFVGG